MYFRCWKGENMVAGHLRQKDGYWHRVLSFIDENGNATSAFNPAIFTKGTEEVETGKGKLPCVVLLKSSDCAFTKGDYLWAIPRNQINLNSNLVQNPGY